MGTKITATPDTYRLIWLDPRQLAEHPHNVRHDLGDVTELADSLHSGAIGLIQPLVVVPLADGHRLVAGHRRNLAAVQAGLDQVPCIERADWADRDEDQLAAMIAENVHREELSAEDEASAYVQLAAFPGWTAEAIARRTGRTVERVRTAITASKLPDDIRTCVHEGGLTLEQAAEIEAFADDPKATDRLLRAAGTGYLHYALADERKKRDTRQRSAALREELKSSGTRIISRPKDWPYGSVEQPIDKLRTADGDEITEASHATCPGHAVFIDSSTAEAITICTHPKDWGHRIVGHYRHLSQEEATEKAAQEEAERERREALATAAAARVTWVRDYIITAKPEPRLLSRVVELLMLYPAKADPEFLVLLTMKRPGDDEPERILARLLKRTSDSRMPLLALAYVAACAESNLSRAAKGQRWSYDPSLTLDWFALLISIGYPLTEQEEALRVDAANAIVEEAELAEEAEAEPEDHELAADDLDLGRHRLSPNHLVWLAGQVVSG